jgi:hypothetical protein
MAQGPASKILTVAYVLACAVVLGYAVAARHIRDTDIFVAYAMLFLTFPSGFVVAALFAGVAYGLSDAFGITVPGGLGNNIVVVLTFGVAGYIQWFVLLPWLWRKVERAI